jgi:diaminopimelate epimerase
MLIKFQKFQATGNDFILIDDRDRKFDVQNSSLIQTICHRKFGVGADGLILFRSEPGVDFRMIYFNSDGYEGSMCGNGGRCAAAFAAQFYLGKQQFNFNAFDGLHSADLIASKEKGYIVRLQMQQVQLPELIDNDLLLDTGSPHFVRFVQDAGSIDVASEGRMVRNSQRFLREGVNVNFVEVHRDSLTVRTYERGVEDETLSCGTGVTASAIASFVKGFIPSQSIKVFTRGGDLEVSFVPTPEGDFADVFLTGEAMPVFSGEIEI